MKPSTTIHELLRELATLREANERLERQNQDLKSGRRQRRQSLDRVIKENIRLRRRLRELREKQDASHG